MFMLYIFSSKTNQCMFCHEDETLLTWLLACFHTFTGETALTDSLWLPASKGADFREEAVGSHLPFWAVIILTGNYGRRPHPHPISSQLSAVLIFLGDSLYARNLWLRSTHPEVGTQRALSWHRAERAEHDLCNLQLIGHLEGKVCLSHKKMLGWTKADYVAESGLELLIFLCLYLLSTDVTEISTMPGS